MGAPGTAVDGRAGGRRAAGGLAGTAASDLARLLLGDPRAAYAAVFTAEAGLFVLAAVLAARVFRPDGARAAGAVPAAPSLALAAE